MEPEAITARVKGKGESPHDCRDILVPPAVCVVIVRRRFRGHTILNIASCESAAHSARLCAREVLHLSRSPGWRKRMAARAGKSATRLGVISRHVCGSASATTAEVTFERRGSVAWLTLARPKALNALTLPMIRALRPALEQSASDASVRCIVMVGEGGKAFCAGGDVRAVCEAAQAGDAALPDAFFREEYQLNHALARSPKPQVSVWDGIVMGGGAGLSVHGRFRVATERTLFAMPETGIGFFPDVGGSHFLQASGFGSG